jgi:hypothetical protein
MLVVLLVAGVPGVAQAGGRDSVAAEHLFQQGQVAVEAADWAGACRYFAESLRLEPAAGTMLNLADCEEHRGRIATAWQLYSDAAAQLDDQDDRRPFATARALALAARTPKLIVRVRAPIPDGARVSRGAVELGPVTLGMPIPVDPGAHAVTLSSPGRAVRRVSVVLAEGETRDVLLEPGEALAPSPRRPTSPLRTAGPVVGGLGVAGLVAGGVTGALAFARAGDVRSHCDAALRCDDDGLDAGRAARSFATASSVSFVAGVIALAAGVSMFLLSPGAR